MNKAQIVSMQPERIECVLYHSVNYQTYFSFNFLNFKTTSIVDQTKSYKHRIYGLEKYNQIS